MHQPYARTMQEEESLYRNASRWRSMFSDCLSLEARPTGNVHHPEQSGHRAKTQVSKLLPATDFRTAGFFRYSLEQEEPLHLQRRCLPFPKSPARSSLQVFYHFIYIRNVPVLVLFSSVEVNLAIPELTAEAGAEPLFLRIHKVSNKSTFPPKHQACAP